MDSDREEAGAGLSEALDWRPWSAPRLSERGVETAFHHTLILVRERADRSPRVVAPADVAGGPGVEWSPMPWALRGRREWVSVRSLGPGAAFRGADDLLFHISDAVCEQLFDGGSIGRRGIAGWVEALRKRIAFCEARGIVYRQLVVPEGHAVYADAIPGAPKLSEDRPLLQILRAGGDVLRERVVYPLDALIEGRARAETGLPHDVHFTGYGYFLIYRELMASMPGVDPESIGREEELRVRNVLVAGDVARSLGLPGRRADFHELPHPRHKALIKGTSYKPHQVDLLQTEETDRPSMVLFRTSNSTHLIPPLLRHFSRIAAVASHHVFYDLIDSERPNVVLCELPERYFALYQAGASDTDRGSPPHDRESGFEGATGYPLPLPRP